MTTTAPEAKGEKPLGGPARFLLVVGGTVVLLSVYLLALVSILLLLGLIGVELLCVLIAARIGASRMVIRYMEKHVALLVLFLKSFRLQKGVEFRIPLRPGDAPGLYEMLGHLCRKLGLALPEEVVLAMGDGAWVGLKGLRSGAGKTTLGVGYDLLAGLTVAEMEAVLAHEMTHAKLIKRGFRNWLNAGQARIRTLALNLWNQVNSARHAGQTAHIAQFLFMEVDHSARLIARLVAAYSRQDEFEADRGAAELCGAATMRTALSKLDSLHRITSRLPWNERVAQLQQTGGYSRWLLREIAQGGPAPAEDAGQILLNKYSTHPNVRDRLAALRPDDKIPPTTSPPGLHLLAEPDEIAVKLITELQELMAGQEKKDSEALAKFSRSTNRNAGLRPWQSAGALLVLGGIGGMIVGLAGRELVVMAASVAAIIGGVVAYRLGHYRDRVDLPVPSYTDLTHPPQAQKPGDDLQEKQKTMADELNRKFAHERKKQKVVALLAGECYAALARCDYLRAHVAARECLKFNNKSIEGALALAVANAAFGQVALMVQPLTFVHRQTGFKTFSTAWGAAWAGVLTGDWIRAEAMLEKALKLQPQHNTLVWLLAIAQSRRGKIQSAIINGRRVCAACPEAREYQRFLIARLLDGGYTREAWERLQPLQQDWDKDHELMICLAQYYLLQRQFPEADHWTSRVTQAGASAQVRVRLGRMYEMARQRDRAAALYQEALLQEHYPEAHLGLGRLGTEQNDKATARWHLLAALNVERPLGKEGVGTLPILNPILTQMLSLHELVPRCRAWIARIPSQGAPPGLAGQAFIVYAPEQAQAQEHFQVVLNAFQPGKPPLILDPDNLRPAPRPLQPDGPVRPGVQSLWH